MKILITGGAGFIGSNLGFNLLEEGHEVTLLDNLKYGYVDNLVKESRMFPNFICMDIRDPKLESVMKDVDVVFHFAGISSLAECNYFPNEAISCNVAGTANVLEMARRNGVERVVFASTSAIYENNTTFPSKESDLTNPTLMYSVTKKNAEIVCQSFRDTYGMDIVIMRFFNVYGPHMDYVRPNPPLVSYIIKCLLSSEQPILHSDGKQSRDMIYVSDVLDMCKTVMVNPKAKNDVFNVGSATTASVSQVYKLVQKAFGGKNIEPIFRKATKIWEKYPGLYEKPYPIAAEILEKEVNKYTLASVAKAKKVLGWSPKISLEEGLRKTVEYAKSTSDLKE